MGGSGEGAGDGASGGGSGDGGSGDGGSGDGGAGGQQQNGQGGQQQNGGQSGQGQQSGSSDKGFPENTPLEQMTVEQQRNYYKHHNRKAETTLGGFKGRTPQQIQDMEAELESLRDSNRTASEKAVKDAEKAARAAADAEWRPKLQTAQLRSIAGEVLKGDDLKNWMFGRDPSAFADENGDIDEEKVMGLLTASHGGSGQQGQQSNGNGQQQHRSWGQNSGGSAVGNAKPGDGGLAAAQRRFGTQNKQ